MDVIVTTNDIHFFFRWGVQTTEIHFGQKKMLIFVRSEPYYVQSNTIYIHFCYLMNINSWQSALNFNIFQLASRFYYTTKNRNLVCNYTYY